MKNNIFEKKIKLANYTTIKVGGLAEYFAEPDNIDDFINLINWSHLNKQKCRIIGAGSNLLINDICLEGLTICTKKMKGITVKCESGIIETDAGLMLPTLSNILAKNGMQGGEWMVGIPGTIGGAICMNAGTGEFSLAKNLLSVKVIDCKNLEISEIQKKDMNFDYRYSPFQENNLLIISAKMKFKTNGNIKKLLETTKNNLKKKTTTQPYHLPSFGSVFKNPINNHAAKMIDELGLKGYKVGGAEISKIHANFIVNKSKASSKDIAKLINIIQQKVLQKKGIYLQPEVRMIGFDYPN